MELQPVKSTITTLRNDAGLMLDTADRLEKIVQMQERGRSSRISPAGLEKIRNTSAAMWHTCPVGCTSKHRMSHPHMKTAAAGQKRPNQVQQINTHRPRRKKAA